MWLILAWVVGAAFFERSEYSAARDAGKGVLQLVGSAFQEVDEAALSDVQKDGAVLDDELNSQVIGSSGKSLHRT